MYIELFSNLKHRIIDLRAESHLKKSSILSGRGAGSERPGTLVGHQRPAGLCLGDWSGDR